MNFRNLILSVVAFGFLHAENASANLVTLESTWRFLNPGHPQDFTSVSFTFDDTVPDGDSSDGWGRYYGSIVSLNFLFRGVTYSLDGTANHIFITRGFELTGVPQGAYISANLTGDDGSTGNLDLRIETDIAVTTDHITELPFLTNVESSAFLSTSALTATGFAASPGFSVVPIPTSAGLLASAFLSLTAIVKRRRSKLC